MAAKARNIVVCNVPDYSSDAVAQHAMGFILMTASGLYDYVVSVNRGDWIKSKSFCYYPYYLTELKGKTLGVLGLGNIGKKVAALGRAFGMNVIACTRTRREDSEYETVDLERLFKESDWLTLHAPLTENTKEIVCAKTLSLMKKTAVLVNTARGGLILSLIHISREDCGRNHAQYVPGVAFARGASSRGDYVFPFTVDKRAEGHFVQKVPAVKVANRAHRVVKVAVLVAFLKRVIAVYSARGAELRHIGKGNDVKAFSVFGFDVFKREQLVFKHIFCNVGRCV